MATNQVIKGLQVDEVIDHQKSERGRLRNAWGSCRTSVDPKVLTKTQGTETSQYLEERTSTETPLVVASERGPGQWPEVRQ